MSNALPPAPIVVDVDGVSHSLKRLSNFNRGVLLGEKFAAQRVKLIENLQAAGITTGAEYFQTLQEFDSLDRNVNAEWVDYCNDGLTDYPILKIAFAKVIKDADEVDRLAQEAVISFEQKADLCGLTITKPKEAPAHTPEGGIDPKTGLPLTYGDSLSTDTPSPEASETNAST